jgi:hypothetical protein
MLKESEDRGPIPRLDTSKARSAWVADQLGVEWETSGDGIYTTVEEPALHKQSPAAPHDDDRWTGSISATIGRPPSST